MRSAPRPYDPPVQLPVKPALALAALALAASGCGGSSGSPGGTLEGYATIGPTCPVERAGTPCPPRPYPGARLAIVSERDGRRYDVTTGSSGSFELTLPTGAYVLTSVGPSPPTLLPQRFAIRPGAPTVLRLRFDSGLR